MRRSAMQERSVGEREGERVAEAPDQFKRKPRRASSKGKRVAMSAEAKQAYEELMRARDERERTYLRHLPHADNKAGR